MEEGKISSRLIPVEQIDVTEHKLISIGHHDLKDRLRDLDVVANARGAFISQLGLFAAGVAAWSSPEGLIPSEVWLILSSVVGVFAYRNGYALVKYKNTTVEKIVNDMLTKTHSISKDNG